MYWNDRGARPWATSARAAAASRLTFHRSQTAVISTFFDLSRATMPASSVPRRPTPMWPSEMRSFAPRIRPYEKAVRPRPLAPIATAPA